MASRNTLRWCFTASLPLHAQRQILFHPSAPIAHAHMHPSQSVSLSLCVSPCHHVNP